MTDHPMLYSAPMVRGLIREANAPFTGKRQTRRISKDQPPAGVSIIRKTIRPLDAEQYHAFERRTIYGNYGGEVPVRIKRGDRIWVRESFRGDKGYDKYPPRTWSHWPVHYEADGTPDPHNELEENGRLRPGIHMPRWASRLTLTVTDVRIERLQDISEADARAEGVERAPDHPGWWKSQTDGKLCPTARDAYGDLWNAINGEGAWQANPWVVAYTFTVQHGNVDQIAKVAA